MNRSRFHIPAFNALFRMDCWFAVLSGALLALAFPKPDISFLAWVAFVPLLLSIGKKSPAGAFRLGFTSGMVAYGMLLYWLNIVMVTYGNLHWSVSVCLYLLLVAYLALYTGIIAWLVRRGEMAGVSPLLSFPILWVGLEFLRSFLMSGFPWASLGYSQYRTLPLIQIADITGVYGLSFLIALANVVLYKILKGIITRKPGDYPAKSAATLLLLMLLTLWYGFNRLNIPENGEQLKVALVQGNISQDVKWDPAFQEQTVEVYERLSRQPAVSGSDLVVWPESAAPFYFQNEGLYAERVRSLAAQLKSFLVFGAPAYDNGDGNRRLLNSAFLLGPDGGTLGRSDKIHLVPFGEYVPLARLLPFVHKLVAGIGDFSPGAEALPLTIGKGKIGVLVCFEGIFPELSRAYVKAGSRILVNISNDAWYKRSSAPYQHLSMTVFRAVENRVPLVRATNTGISAIIDSRGHIRGTTPLFKEAVLTGEVRLGAGGAFYTLYGDLFAWACLSAAALLAGILLLRKREKRSNECSERK
jgi:apolipoprotein N-acyltransferase